MRDRAVHLTPILQGRALFLKMWWLDFLVIRVCYVSRSNLDFGSLTIKTLLQKLPSIMKYSTSSVKWSRSLITVATLSPPTMMKGQLWLLEAYNLWLFSSTRDVRVASKLSTRDSVLLWNEFLWLMEMCNFISLFSIENWLSMPCVQAYSKIDLRKNIFLIRGWVSPHHSVMESGGESGDSER